MMDTTNYTQLFDMDDSDLFHGLNLTDTMYNIKNEDIYTSSTPTSNPYLQYLQSNDTLTNNNNNNSNKNNMNDTFANNNNNDTFANNGLFYDNQFMMIPNNNTNNMDLLDYDYFSHPHNVLDQQQQQKQQYNWLYDSNEAYLSHTTHPLFCDQLLNDQPMDSIMSDHLEDTISTVDGGMSRGYVSLSDVNSFVAEADSVKHSASFLSTFQHPQQCCSSSESTTNEESEEEYSDSEGEFRWPPMMNTSYSTPTSNKQKLMIKIKKPSSLSNSAMPSPYGDHWNNLVSPKKSNSSNTTSYRAKHGRKSMSNIFNLPKNKNNLLENGKRRGSAPHRLTLHHTHSSSSLSSLHSSSSLTSLSNNLARSMRVSDLFSEDEEEVDEEEDEEDEEYNYAAASAGHPHQLPIKKGRNVDKACNHCKRSHLRCDDMRPCRRCVATGKTGCKDVQHKPRGRPKLHKK